jgi:hypothetical protein
VRTLGGERRRGTHRAPCAASRPVQGLKSGAPRRCLFMHTVKTPLSPASTNHVPGGRLEAESLPATLY